MSSVSESIQKSQQVATPAEEETPPEHTCGMCHDPQDACRCVWCKTCEEWHAEPLCTNCERCANCCECSVCARGRCGARVDSVCDRCERCDDCCECQHCDACNYPYEYTCGACNCCDDCCDCWYCHGCDEPHDHDTPQCSDCSSCPDCCECSKSILDYSTDVTDYLRFQGKPAGGLYLGVELEVECTHHVDAEDKAHEWLAADATFLRCKHDSSLDDGFEIVTAPASLELQKAHWARLLSDADLKEGLRSWDTNTCGMHVHASRKALSPLQLGKLLVFLNSPKTHQPIVRLAGRTSEDYAAFASKKVSDGGKAGGERFEALNLCNFATIEFRIFKGTLRLQHVLANIEFCHAAICWAKDVSLQDIETWASFWAFVTSNRKAYKNLIAYMKERAV